jgi:hypothetical protein
MKWFDQWFYRKARWAWKRGNYQYPELRLEQDLLDRRAAELYNDHKLQCDEISEVGEDPASDSDGMRIDIRHVMGGYVVTVRHDRRENHKSNTLHGYQEPVRASYIVTDEQDFDRELCKILSMERLKQ